jgi:cbb3-type cytochrome oxidase maturation protein|tara:strand:- start:299 stop:493 length:195 start_codon:yes stop_codon:yes gene_type:complete
VASSALIILSLILVIGGIGVVFFLWALNSGKLHQPTPEQQGEAPAALATAANEAADSESGRDAA